MKKQVKNTDHLTREQWLESAVVLVESLFTANKYEVPRVRVSCGWPSSRGCSAKKAALGECWASEAADDKLAQIFISPRLDKSVDAMGVLPVLLHEVVHAVVGNKAKHGPVFKKCALAVGLEGKMTSTTAGEALLKQCAAWEKQLGPYPHAKLNPNSRPTPKQTTRMVKCECKACGFVARTSRKWLEEIGAPLCACNKMSMHFEIPEELGGGDDED